MKSALRILAIFTLIMATSSAASADAIKSLVFEAENYRTGDDSFQPGFAVLQSIQADPGALGGFVYAYVNEDYAEAYAGFTLSFSKTIGRHHDLQLGSGIGIEQSRDRNPLRLALLASINSTDGGPPLFAALYEVGADHREFKDHFYSFRLAVDIHEFFDIGVIARRDCGVGPRLDYWAHRPNLGTWLAPVYNFETDAYGLITTLVIGY